MSHVFQFLISVFIDVLLTLMYWVMIATYGVMGLIVGAVLGVCILFMVPLMFVRAVHAKWRAP